MDKYPNIYGDVSAGSGRRAISNPKFGREFIIRRADRLLFGTDYLAVGPGNFAQFTILDGFNLPDEVQAKVYRDNARRLMGLI
jgi:predicted TIM-barrel fold metal-dependent hydrolase